MRGRDLGLLLAVACAFAGCERSAAKRCTEDAGCGSDAFCNGGFCQEKVPVIIESPAGTVYVSGSVDFQVTVKGDPPGKVELLSDGVPFADLKIPYAYSWDTTGVAEGAHAITARATIGVTTYTSAPLTVVVDRRPPVVVSRTPAPGDANVWLRDPIRVVFSEAMKASTVGDNSVIVTGDCGMGSTHASLSSDGKTLTILPVSTPSVPCSVTATFTDGLTDLAGNALVLPENGWTWSLPVWQQMGGALSFQRGYEVSMAVDASGNPVVAWVDLDTEFDLYVKKWSGNSWLSLGGALNSQYLIEPSLALDSGGNPVVAWSEASGIHVKKWDAVSWVSLGGPLSPDGVSTSGASLGLDSSGHPTVAFLQDVGNRVFKVFVKKWNGTSWVLLGGALNYAWTAGAPSLALNTAGDPVVAWSEWNGTMGQANIFVKQWKEGYWWAMGGALNTTTRGVGYARLALDPHGLPVVAWLENTGDLYGAVAKRWDGGSWVALGSTLNADGKNTFPPSLTVDSSGNPVVALVEATGTVLHLYVKRWNSNSWVQLGGPLEVSVPSNPYARSVALALYHDNPLVTWSETPAVYVKRYNH